MDSTSAAAVAPTRTASEGHELPDAPSIPCEYTLSVTPTLSAQSSIRKSSGSSSLETDLDIAGATSLRAPKPAGPYPSATLTSATHTSRTSAASEGRTPANDASPSVVSEVAPVPSGLGSRNARANRHHGQGGSLRYPPWVCVRSHSVSVSLMSACGAPYASGTTPSAGGGGAVRGSRGGRSAIASLAFSI